MGDYVQLRVREKPFAQHSENWWWRITRIVDDFSFDAVYERRSAYGDTMRVVESRWGVGHASIIGRPRHPNEAP